MMEEIVGLPAGKTTTGLGSFSLGNLGRGRYTNPVIQTLAAYALVASGEWVVLWGLFGGANQLLAALALLTATVWLANWDDSKQLISTGVPMVVMTVITVLGLLWLAIYENIYTNILQGGADSTSALISSAVQAALAFVLIYLALSLVRIGYANIRDVRREGGTVGTPSDD
jgi:carbon starvation protein